MPAEKARFNFFAEHPGNPRGETTMSKHTDDDSALDLADGSPRPFFHAKEATHYGIFKMPNGSEITVIKTPTAYFIGAAWDGVTQYVALGHEAADMVASALLLSRSNRKPLPNATLLPVPANTKT